MPRTRSTSAAATRSRKRSTSNGKSTPASKSRHHMSTASKVAIASAAGVLAATAIGLATTEKGRKLTRQVEQKITPMMRRKWSTVVSAVEASLAEHGILEAIPARVRDAVVQRLCMNGETMSNRASTPAAPRTSRGRKRAASRG